MNCPNGKTKVLGIIGHPVGHSLSPVMQNTVLAACGLDYIYVPFDVLPGALCDAISGLRALGVSGFNVTIPHKSSVIEYLDALDESAEAAGAVNTVFNDGGRLIGYNTDGDGLVRSLAEDLGYRPVSGVIVVAGAGGASRGAIASLCRSGAEHIVIINRSPAKAVHIAETLGYRYSGTRITVADSAQELKPWMGKADLLINTTSIGMNNDIVPYINLSDLPGHAMVYDMVYAPAVTPLLAWAAELGLRCANGLGMLAGQGELAFQIWTGMLPPRGLMKKMLTSI